MEKTVRVGVIGTSWWADLLHLPSLKSHPQAEIVAICGRTREPAEELAAKYGIARVFSDYRDMIANANLDAVLVVTPDDTHYPATMAALDAGLHVLCEKPLASNASQAHAMYLKAEAVGVTHMTFFTWRWMPPTRYIHSLVEEGFVGKPYQCHLRFIGDYGHDPQYSWRLDPQRGNGISGDLGIHMIDMARWLVGDITRVCANLKTHVNHLDVQGQPSQSANDSALLMLEFANGAHGIIEAHAMAHLGERGMDQRFTLHGAAGSLESVALYERNIELFGARPGQEQPQQLVVPDHLWGDVDPSLSFIPMVLETFTKQSAGPRLFVDAILEGRQVRPSFYDGWKAQEVHDAAIISHQEGRWVDVG